MSKPKKKRPHKCRKGIPGPGKYANTFKCKVCRYRERGAYGWSCLKCGGNMIRI